MIKTTIKLIDYCTPVLNSINNCIKQMGVCVSQFEMANEAAFGGGSERVYDKNLGEIPKTANDVDEAINSVVESTERLGDVADGIPDSFDKINESINSINSSTKKLGGNILGGGQGASLLTGAFGGLSGIIKKAAIAFGAAFSARKFIGWSDEISGISARISNAFDMSGDELDQYMNKIYNVANGSRGAYTDIANSISKLGMQAKNAFGDPDELLAFSDVLNKTFAISGTDSMGVQSTMYNLTQALASGVLRGQDLNAVMSNAPIILEKVANYLGTDISMIRKFAEEGKLSSDVIKNAMLGASDEINEKFNKMPLTFNNIMTRLVNVIKKSLSGAFVKWNELLNTDEFNYILSWIEKGFGFLGDVLEFVIDTAGDLIPILVAIADAIWPVIAAFGVWEAAAIAVNIALNANPIILILTIVLGLIVACIKYFDDFGDGMIDFLNIIKAVIGGIITMISSLVIGIVQLVLHALQIILNMCNKVNNALINLINKIPGVNIKNTSDVTFASDFDKTAKKWRDGIADTLLTPIEYNRKVEENVNVKYDKLGNFEPYNYADQLNNIGGGVSGINDKLDKGIDVKNEDIKELADLMFNRAISNITLDKVEVKVDNTFGDIHENADADEIAARIADGIVLSMNTSAIGV